MTRIHISRAKIPVYLLIFFGALMFFMGIMNHYYFRTFVFDYGNYNFAFRDYAHFRQSPMPTYPGYFLQDHFSLLLLFLVPVYWLLNWLTGTYTLIIIQNALIIIAAWYTYRLIMLKSGNIWLGTAVIIYYFTLLGRYSTFAGDVNLAVMSACFIPVFLYYFEQRKYVISLVILLLSLLSRENIPIWFIFIFAVLLIRHHREKRAVAFSISGIVISVVYFILLFRVFIPGIENEDKQYTLFNYSALGPDPGNALLFVVSHPVETIKMFFVNHLGDPRYDRIKAEFYVVYLVSGGFVLLLRPRYLIWFIPIVAQKVLNDAPIRWGILTYYSIEVVTLLPLSVFLIISSLKSGKWQTGIAIAVCIATISMTIYKLDRVHRVVPERFRSNKEKFYGRAFYQSPYDLKETHRILKSIPSHARVSASENFFPHLSQRKYIRYFPEVDDAEYIILSIYDKNIRYSEPECERETNRYLSSDEWEVIEKSFPVFLLKKKE